MTRRRLTHRLARWLLLSPDARYFLAGVACGLPVAYGLAWWLGLWQP